MRYFIYILLVFSLFISCKKDFEGDKLAPQLPETFMVVDSVVRDPSNYLITTVQAYWWGNSAKGFITGYEVSIDGMQTWKYTKDQKGTFLLNLPVGVKKGDIPVYVRAIDNMGYKDPTPAQMLFPVKNTAPHATIDISNPLPDASFPVIKFNWLSADIDGVLDIDHYELSLNQTSDSTAFFKIPGTLTDLLVNDTTVAVSVRIEAQKVAGQFVNSSLVYPGTKATAIPGILQGIKFDSINVINIRVVDKTGNVSNWIKDSLMVNKPSSDILMVNALYSNASLVQNFYLNTLSNTMIGISGVEVLRGVNSLNGSTELYTDALTQQKTFSLFKKIIWLTDDPNTLATAQLTTNEFFNAGGKMYIYAQFGDDFPVNSQVLNFTPIQSMVDPNSDPNIVNGRFRMDNTCTTTPILINWPSLKYNGSIGVMRPFVTNNTQSGNFSYDSLMNAVVRIQSSSGSPYWSGSSTAMSRRVRISSGKTDMIITSLPMQNLNGNNNIDSLFKKVFIDELAFN